MENKKELLAYCGLYCGDCLGYTGSLAKRAKSLMTVLEKHQFNLTAKTIFPKELKEYDRFHQMLGSALSGLRSHVRIDAENDAERTPPDRLHGRELPHALSQRR